ncbi:sensor histidine kinase [Sulfitobacter donghicola]|uniref:histidine kinase n=1 Tax=Sulfitobacter donghicola DSW-25 = KCTC 12864 = JCM 14565 TaxID=1300350 RepID=A0A073IJG7_9RHOB|nr:PAS domain-containing sensor histidine kinase [Sulfitobacter donghicola]KEJ89656.1 hypothetical protein DSW25_10675 [Sulfitobacter donghicola DSW-25 = KCTC 12864 = JCM 14565]KIN69283.1 Histidine kinase [Sulfitobacter donghicola DSW-25 = KCTC 12864 = JCM 14565]
MPDNYLDDQFALLDCIPTPVFILNVDGQGIPTYAHCNLPLLSYLARELSDFVGHTAPQVFGPEFGDIAFTEQRKAIASRSQHQFEITLHTGDQLRTVRTTLFPQMDQDGRVVRLVGSVQDISSEEIAQTTQEKLNEISTEVEQFIAMAAHDLRTPMRNIMDLADMLHEDFEDQGDEKLGLLNLLKETAEKSMDLISDVLSYASTLGPVSPNTSYNLAELGKDLMLILDPKGAHQLICSDINLNGEKSVMQIALRNLIDNAIKHGQRDRLTLCCTARLDGENAVEIVLTDNGVGFENPGIAFLETGTFRTDSGYGLLAIRKLITARGGKISAQNNPSGQGSRINLSLPNQIDDPKQTVSDSRISIRPASTDRLFDPMSSSA